MAAAHVKGVTPNSEGPVLTVRPADPGEHEVLTALAHRAKAHWGYPAEMLAMWDESLTLTRQFVASNDVLCAVDEGRVVGVAALCLGDSGFELEHLWVEPERQGRGVGRLLICAVIERARAHGAARLRVVSDPNAEGFYVRMGARPVGVTESSPGRVLPVLELDITV